ncbi:MAG: DUF5606 domain-containing protein [Prevotellaceae bacterium]|jgi:hypothetical protein|nr:DUF5606 domain-containing protein [Prevotellaceae bacterium]
MKTDLQKVLYISGYPGLFTLISQGRNGVIVEAMSDKKRMSAGPSMRVTNLSEVAMFTDADEIPLKEVLLKIKAHLDGKPAIDHKSDATALHKFMETVLPNYDRARVYTSHIKKLVEWYNILQKNDMLEFEDDEKEEDKKEDKEETKNKE